MKILFITSRFPFPLITGDRLRSYIQIKNLARDHEVVLACLDTDVESAHIEEMSTFCSEIHLGSTSRPRSFLQAALALVGGRTPLQVAYFHSKDLGRKIDDLVTRHDFDIVHVHLIRCAPYVAHRPNLPRVIDMCDALSLEYERRVKYQRSKLRPIYALEAKRLASYEREIADDYDRTIMISPTDADALGTRDDVDVLVNSVRMSLDAEAPDDGDKEPNSIVYTGYIGFYSDEIAILYFCDHVFPRVLREIPDAKFYIVGAEPSPRVRALTSDNIVVTGYVDDIASYLRAATISVSPMRVGAGLKNKILEAFVHRLPVVATTLANQGIGGVPGEHLMVADDPDGFARAVVELLRDPQLRHDIGARAFRFVAESFSDDVVRVGLAETYRRVSERRARERRTG